MPERVKIILANGAVIAVLCLLLFISSVWWRMSTQFNLGEQAFKRGDFTGAVSGYESALHMYIPGHPAMERAARQLWTLGESNERLGDIDRALIAYRSLRSSFYAAKWLITPGEEWIARCDKRIRALEHQQISR